MTLTIIWRPSTDHYEQNRPSVKYVTPQIAGLENIICDYKYRFVARAKPKYKYVEDHLIAWRKDYITPWFFRPVFNTWARWELHIIEKYSDNYHYMMMRNPLSMKSIPQQEHIHLIKGIKFSDEKQLIHYLETVMDEQKRDYSK